MAQGISALSAFFTPKSVALVGASSDPKKPGHTMLRNMIAAGYKGKMFPVNPRESVILGLPCYKSVLDIPEPVEACALMVSSDMAVSVAKELAERKKRFNDVAAVVCMSAGFGEINTPEGTKRERDMVESLRSADIRMVGPNCVGVMNTVSGFNTNFDIGAYPSGGISLLTQSGAFGNSFLFAAGGGGRVGLNKYVSVGNMADVQMAELLMFLENDDSTRVIGIYLEGLSDPRRFFEAADKVALAKPVVVLKSGRSELGSTAALSHTGAIAGADAIYDGAFRQFGLIRARSIAEFSDTLRAFSKQPVPTGNRFAVLTHMGGPGTMCIDEISALPAIKMATFSNATQTALKSMLSSAANIGHPPGYIDMTATSSEALHNQVLTLLFKDPNVDAVIQILGPSAFHVQPQLAKEVATAYQGQSGTKKPLLNVVMFGEFGADLRQGLEDAGLPTFDFPDTVARVAANLSGFAAVRAAAVPRQEAIGSHRRARRAADRYRGQGGSRQPARAGSLCGVQAIRCPSTAIQIGGNGPRRRRRRKRYRLSGRAQSGVGADPAQIGYRRRDARHQLRWRSRAIVCTACRERQESGARHSQPERARAEDDAVDDRAGAGSDPR